MNRRSSRQSGFSLVELLVTALIFGIGLLGLATLQVSTLRSNSGGKNRVTAAALAEGCLSAIQSEGGLSWTYASGTLGTAAAFPAASRRFTNPGVAGGDFGFFDVHGNPVAGPPTQVFRVEWRRLNPTSATPGAPILGMNLNEFVVSVTWRDQEINAQGGTMDPSTLSLSRLIRH